MRYKPKYNSQKLIYQDPDGNEYMFYCDELSYNQVINMQIGQPIKDSGARFITDSEIEFSLNGKIIQGESIARILALPEITPKTEDNNSRRGRFRADKVIVISWNF